MFKDVPWVLCLHPITVPELKSLLAPSRNRSVTVPGVVGFHWISVGLPAVKENPWGTLKGLGPVAVCARTAVEKAATARNIERIVDGGQLRPAFDTGDI